MKLTLNFTFIFLLFACSTKQQQAADGWPKFKHYDQNHLLNISLPLGGIGTGTVGLGGRGELRDWQIMNKPSMKYSAGFAGNDAPFFSIFVKEQEQAAKAKALLGPVHPSEYLHHEGRAVNHHGLPRFTGASFDGAYPFGQVNLEDELLPVSVKIKAFNPLVPGDAEASGIPIAILNYEVTNNTDAPMEVSVCGSMRNFIGMDGSKYHTNHKGERQYSGAKKNINTFFKGDQLSGIYMTSDGVNKIDPAWGTIALTTPSAEQVSYRRSNITDHWNVGHMEFWDDFSDDGLLTDKEELVTDNPVASLAVKKVIPARSVKSFKFYLTWHFPNRLHWFGNFKEPKKEDIIGNYYTTKYSDAKNVIETEFPNLASYENKTKKFVSTFLNTTVPDVVKEAALFNLSTIRSQTVFRIPSGHMLGWEGIMKETGSCYGSCTHVWNYETATSYLFGNLAHTMRDVEFNYGTNNKGAMNNRVSLPLKPLDDANAFAAADGQMGTIMRFYRDWMLSGDIEFLKKFWPRVKLAMEYAWVENGWDANQDGVQEGRQHNTMDVDYYGANPQMQFWYFGALKASEKLAEIVGDKEFATKCKSIREKGSKWVDENLFNGEYYEHKITDPKDPSKFLDLSDPKTEVPWFQLGQGCLVDQLAGQYMAHVCGLGYLAKEENIKTALKTIMSKNYVEKFENVYNNMRSYVMGDESGLIMSSWPKERLKVPFPYWSESMTGFEYTAAIGMIQEGQVDAGLKCITAIRDRFDGEKRNPFDEPECGHFYARAMASWSAPMAFSKFRYNAYAKNFHITAKPGTYFWSTGNAWGNCVVQNSKFTINVEHGEIKVGELHLDNGKVIKNPQELLNAEANKTVTLQL